MPLDVIVRDLQRLVERGIVPQGCLDRLAVPEHLITVRVPMRGVKAHYRNPSLVDCRLILNHEPPHPPGLNPDTHAPPSLGSFVLDIGGQER